MAIAFVGPSGALDSWSGDVQRSFNLEPLPIESGNTKTKYRFRDWPGLRVFSDLEDGPVRGSKKVLGRAFAVAGPSLYEVFSDGTKTLRHTLDTLSGFVDMTFNSTQLCVADGASLYVMTLASNSVQQVNFATTRIGYLDQFVLGITADTQRFKWSNIGDATSLDLLNFSSADGSPDNIVSMIIDHREALFLGTDSGEVWGTTGDDRVFGRNSGAFIEVGCAAAFSAEKLDGGVYFLGSGEKGARMVWKLEGYRPVRVSTMFVEERLKGLDLSLARAYTYQMNGCSYYVLNVPGLSTTLVYNAFSGLWHEIGEYVDGEFSRHRGTCHMAAFNEQLLGADDGKLYALDDGISNNAGDVLCRSRIMPTNAVPSLEREFYSRMVIDCDAGHGGQVMLRYSNDGTPPSGAWRTTSLGATGDRLSRPTFNRLGSGPKRVFQLQVTDNVRWNPSNVEVT